MRIDFVLDYRSPYAYLANTQIGAFGAEVGYQPVDIFWVMKQVDNNAFPMCPTKAKYADRCFAMGAPLRRSVRSQ
jgi:2-hydroxychromene-2-carboxylate isomerase